MKNCSQREATEPKTIRGFRMELFEKRPQSGHNQGFALLCFLGTSCKTNGLLRSFEACRASAPNLVNRAGTTGRGRGGYDESEHLHASRPRPRRIDFIMASTSKIGEAWAPGKRRRATQEGEVKALEVSLSKSMDTDAMHIM